MKLLRLSGFLVTAILAGVIMKFWFPEWWMPEDGFWRGFGLGGVVGIMFWGGKE